MAKTNKPNRAAGMLIGCATWFLVLSVLLSCLIPFAIFGGMFSGFLVSDQVAKIVGPLLCPQGTTAYIHTFPTTSLDENGFEQPATGFEMLCRQPDGATVNPSFDYQFAWMGILVVITIVLSAIVSIFIAGPVGIVVNKVFDRLIVKKV